MKPIEGIVKILDFGAKKYAPESWKEEDTKTYYAAMMRHICAYSKGEVNDKESGLPHMYHIMTNAIFISELEPRFKMEEFDIIHQRSDGSFKAVYKANKNSCEVRINEEDCVEDDR